MRGSRATGAAGAFLLAALAVGLTGSAAGAQQPARPVRQEAVALDQRGCPTGALRLPADAVARAAEAARNDARSDRTVIVASILATSAAPGSHGAQVASQCGSSVAGRTVVVDLFYPWLLPSASLTQGTVFVSYFAGRYRVWEVAH
jgi:hypothetical protein